MNYKFIRTIFMIGVLALFVTVGSNFYIQAQEPVLEAEKTTATSSVPHENKLQRDDMEVVAEDIDFNESVIYLIRLQDQPLALYRGDIAGLAATSPAVNNRRGLDLNSEAVVAYSNYLAEQRESFLLDARHLLDRELEVVYEYYVSNNGLAVWLTPAEAARVAQLEGVIFIQQDEERELHTDNGPAWVGAPTIWDGSSVPGGLGTLGEGMVVGIIDTGINYSNPSFAAVGPVDGHVHTNPLGSGNFIGDCAPGGGFESYCNDKLIGVRGYATVNGGDPVDTNGHGSHVAGTAAGNVVTATVDAPTTTITRTISGVAPHANIISYNGCCTVSALTAAIEDIVTDYATLLAADANVRMSVNYSIGSVGCVPTPNMWSDFDTAGYLAARDAGIFVATSAGNCGPGFGTLGSPADAPWLTSVGNSTHNRVWSNNLIDMSGGDTAAPADISGKGLSSGYGPADIVYAGDYPSGLTSTPELCGVGNLGDFISPWPPGTFNGEIVVCDRGTYGRVEMGANVLAAGAGGYVLANHAAAGNALVGDAHALPGVHITFADGVVLKTWLASGAGHTATITGATIDEDVNNGDIMASGSSRGPNRALPDIISPNVTAPGTDILAPYGTDNAIEWDMISGTSMASPHVAGAAALLMALYPDLTPAEVQSALMLTAWQDMFKEDGTTPTDPFDMGSGRIDLTVAAQVGLVMDETTANYENANPGTGGDPKTLNLPSMGNAQCIVECSWTRTVRSVAQDPITYTAAVDVPAGMTLTVEPASFTIDPGATQVLTITADVTGLSIGDWAFAEVQLVPGTTTELLNESFTDASFPPTDWASYKLAGGGTQEWVRVTSQFNSPPASAHRVFGGFGTGFHDDWLVTPPLTITLGTASLTYIDAGQWMDDYGYSGVWVSTESCDPADNDFVEVAEIDNIPGAGSATIVWRTNPVTLDLSPWAGETVCLAFRYSGDFAHSWWVDDIVVQEFEPADVVAVHMPVAVVPAVDAPLLTYSPGELESNQQPNQVVAQTLTIGNIGTLPLDWELFQLSGDAAQITTMGSGIIWNQPRVGSSGRINNFSNPDDTGIYQSSPFTLFTDVEIDFIFAEGFFLGGTLADATALNWYIYEDVDGSPAGNPEDGQNLHVWSYTANVGDPGVDITANDMTLDLIAAGEPPVALGSGVYWILAYPDIPVFSLGPNVLYAWFHSSTGTGQQIGPAGLAGFPTSWSGVPEGRAFRLEGQIDCTASDISWLSLSPTSGTVDPGSSQDVTATFDSTGLGEGVYNGTLCLATNDPDNEIVLIPVTLEVEILDDPITGLEAANDSPTIVGNTTTLTATIETGTNVTYEWDFGDGTTTGINDFSGDFDMANWMLVNNPPGVNGSVDSDPGPPVELFVTGGNDDVGGVTDFEITIPTDGIISFNWGYQSTDTDCWDSGGVVVNGVYDELACNNAQVPFFDASYSVTVAAGDTFAFRVRTDDGEFGAGIFGVTNFNFQPTGDVNEVNHTYAEVGIYTATVTATNPLGSVSATTIVEIVAEDPQPEYGVELSPATAAATGEPGDTVEYTLTITNTGDVTDTFVLTVSGNDWSVDLPDEVELGAGESTTLSVTVTIPATAEAGDMDAVTVTATSTGDPDQSASSVLTTTAEVEEPEVTIIYMPIISRVP